MWAKLFLDHSRTVEESYREHAVFVGRFAWQLCGAAFCALIHALIPGMFEETASKIVARLYAKTSGRGR